MKLPHDDRHSIAIAAHWVSQITAVALEIALPVVLGRWLDERWGTSYWTFIGAVVGPLVGMWHLLTLTGVVGGRGGRMGRGKDRQQ